MTNTEKLELNKQVRKQSLQGMVYRALVINDNDKGVRMTLEDLARDIPYNEFQRGFRLSRHLTIEAVYSAIPRALLIAAKLGVPISGNKERGWRIAKPEDSGKVTESLEKSDKSNKTRVMNTDIKAGAALDSGIVDIVQLSFLKDLTPRSARLLQMLKE